MYAKLKYLYLLSGLACAGNLLFSCSSDTPDQPGTEKGTEVIFSTSADTAAISRASATISIDNFTVYGDMKFMGETQSSPIKTFDKTSVVKTDDAWQYQGTRYWFPKHEHTFVAVHPESVLDDAQYADSKLSFTYTLPASNDEATDIIAATHRRLYQEEDASTTVTFHFGHLLSLINFTVELDENSKEFVSSVKIHKLEMSGFGTSAAIDIKPAPRNSNSQTDDSEIGITTTAGTGKLEINFAEPKEVSTGGAFEPLILLPQSFSAGEEVKVSVTYSVDNETETAELSTTISDFKWESGTSYNYKIIMNLEPKEANMIITNATIDPWILVDDTDNVEAR